MEIQRLKKSLMREELQRRYPHRTRNRILAGTLLCLLVAGGFVYYQKKKDDLYATRYHKGVAQWEKGDYEEAVKTLRGVYDGYPGFSLAPDALYHSAEVLNLNLLRYQEALLSYLLVLRDYPDNALSAQALRKVAKLYKYRLMDYPAAIVAYQRLLDQGEWDRDNLLYEVADAYFRLNNFEQARIEFENLASEHPHSPLLPEVTYRTAVCYALEGSPERAETIFRDVIARWPESPYGIEARFGLAEVLETMERLRESAEVLRDLQGHYPKPEVLQKKLEQVNERIRKKQRAV